MSKPILESHIASGISTPIRLQDYGVGIFNTVNSKSSLKKHIKKGLIQVNDTTVTTATFIKNDDKIELYSSDEKTTQKKLVLKLEVLFEDDFLAIIYKPPGILVSGNKFKTIDNALTQNLAISNQLDSTRPRPVHRLDYPTSGLLLIGKTVNSIVTLNKLFEQKEVSKTYYAVTMGNMPPSGIIDTTIDNKASYTVFDVKSTVESPRFKFLNLVKLTPKTGRKHQLRIHMSNMGNPILGDQKYGDTNTVLKGKGLYLHAYSLEFTHPITEEKLSIKTECPKKFKKIFPNFELI